MPQPIGRFVAYDIVPIADFDDGEPQAHPSMAAARRASDATFWSLYGITPEGQVIRVGNHCAYEWCAEIYTRITGCIVPENPDALRLTSLPAAR